MSLPQSFWDRLPLRADADLLEMMAHPADYEPEALEAIKSEWSKRNLPSDRIVEVTEAVRARADQAVAEATIKAQEPLNWIVTVFCFVYGFTLLPVFAVGYYRAHGYQRKAKTAGVAMIIGFLCFVVGNGLRNCDSSS